ncbi:MAG: MBL fold metallo-hydrolase [Solirubrobacteraceae bacterium]
MAREVIPDVVEALFPRAAVHAFVVRADVPTLIDTGTPGDLGTVERALRRLGLDVGDLGRIILTHAHADHAGNAAVLAGRSGAEVHVSPGSAPYVTGGSEQARPRAATLLGHAMVPYVKVALPWKVARVRAQATLVEGAMIGPFAVLETPGHQAGHVSLLWEQRGVLFTGDAAANLTRIGPHPAAEDPAQARESFRRLGSEDYDVALFGHGRALTSNAGRRLRSAA